MRRAPSRRAPPKTDTATQDELTVALGVRGDAVRIHGRLTLELAPNLRFGVAGLHAALHGDPIIDCPSPRERPNGRSGLVLLVLPDRRSARVRLHHLVIVSFTSH